METSHKYKFTIDLFGEQFDDVSAFSVLRCPIIHTGSFSVLNLELRGLVFLTLCTEIENGDFPEISIKCELLDMTQNESPSKVGKPTHTMFRKQYLAIKANTNEYPTANSTYLNCAIVLVNPILHKLNNTNSYNKILLGKTAMDILEDYESHLKKTFGNCFEFKKIGKDTKKNNHSYEQLLIRLENDLLIPSWLIAEYKPNQTFSFYFFDDFRIDSSSKKDITAYYINMGAKDDFEKKTTLRTADDIFMANTFQKSYQMGDPFSELKQDNASVICKNREIAFKFEKATGTASVPSVTQSNSTIPLDKRSVSSVLTTKPSTRNVKPTDETLLYGADSIENVLFRLTENQKLLELDISGIASWTLKDSHFDFIQFGVNYVLNPFESKENRYTPISIVNSFVREAGQFPFLIHNCAYQTIKFKANSDWGQ